MALIGKIQNIIGIMRDNGDLSTLVEVLKVLPKYEEVLDGVGLQADEKR